MLNTRHQRPLGAGFLLASVLAAAPTRAATQAEDITTADPPRIREQDASGFVSGARTFARGLGVGFELDGRYRFTSRLELGLAFEGAYLDRGYLSGLVVSPAVTGGAALVLLAPVASTGPLELFVRYAGGASYLEGVERSAHAIRQTNEVGAFGHLVLGERGLLRAGVLLGVELELEPTTDLADQSQAVTFGYGHAVSEHVLLFADAIAGGTFGFNGDNGKSILEASLGVRVSLPDGGARGAF